MNNQENEKIDYYKYAYRSYVTQTIKVTKSSIIEDVFDYIFHYLTYDVGKIGLSNEKEDIEEIESVIQSYYKCSILGEDIERVYSNIKNRLLPNLIEKLNKAIDNNFLEKESWSSLLTHLFMTVRDYMDKVEEKLKEERV